MAAVVAEFEKNSDFTFGSRILANSALAANSASRQRPRKHNREGPLSLPLLFRLAVSAS